jgi:hypothetical protein
MVATTTQYVLTGIAAAGIAFFYDFKSWQNSGQHDIDQLYGFCLTHSRNWRHTAYLSGLPEDSTMGTLSAL